MFTPVKDLPKAVSLFSSAKTKEIPAYMPTRRRSYRRTPTGFVAPKQTADMVSQTLYRNTPIHEGQRFDVLMPNGKTVLKNAGALLGTYVRPLTAQEAKATIDKLDPVVDKGYIDNPYQIVEAAFFPVMVHGLLVLLPATRLKLRRTKPTKAERNLARVRGLKEKAKKIL
jgi:hypothetical protein